MSIFDCVIIGAGPAGMTAAIYLKRSQIDFTIIEQSAPGGQLLKSSKIENYPGFTQKDGATLAQTIYNQLDELNVDYRYGKVTKIKRENNYFTVETDVEELKTKKIIIATGRQPKRLKILNEEKYIGRGISFCATCDGNLYKNKIVGVVGYENRALEETLYLSKLCSKVYLFYPKKYFDEDQNVLNLVKQNSNIEIIQNVQIKEILEENNQFKGVKTASNEIYLIDGLFVFIGQIPSLFYQEQLELKTADNYIIVNSNMETSIEGIYAIGDIIKKDFYQITTAVSEGTIAALNIIKQLKEKR